MNICDINDCDSPIVNKRGWCSKHYMKWYRHGDPLFKMPDRVWRTPTHRVWAGMKQRCDDQNFHAYRHYGGRGIKYDPKWNTYKGFLEDMGERPAGMSLDRIDNNDNYTKENCRWATPKTQANNRRDNVFVEYRGQKRTIAQWEQKLGLPDYTLGWRINNGWSTEDAIETPLKVYKNTRSNA